MFSQTRYVALASDDLRQSCVSVCMVSMESCLACLDDEEKTPRRKSNSIESAEEIEPITDIRRSRDSSNSICSAGDSLEDLTVLRYVDLDDYDRRITFYEIGHEHNSKTVSKKRYTEFSKFFKCIEAKAIEESLPIFEHYKFPNKSLFNTSSEYTKERRIRGFKSLLRLVIQHECLHSALLDFIGVEYEMRGDTVMVVNIADYFDESQPQRRHSRGSKTNVTSSKVLHRVRQGYTAAIGGSFLTAEAIIQGFLFNQGYVPIRNPDGPTKGTEQYAANYALLAGCGDSQKDLFRRIRDTFFAGLELPVNVPEESLASSKRMRLLFVGDSLVCGVGCDNDVGPIMPHVIARCFSLVFRAEVVW